MQISEMLGRYSSALNGADRTTQTEQASLQKNEKLTSLSVGSVFEGTVGKMEGGTVQLLLGNGQSVNARLGAEMALFPGQSMFFEVAGKDGQTVSIRPFQQGGEAGNPTLLNALDAAGLKADASNLHMVETMMQENLSIDKNSLNDMARLIRSNPEIDQTTLIQMKKLDIPISKEMAAQFENYKTDSHQILSKMDEVLSNVTNALGDKELSGKEALGLNEKILSILSEEAPKEPVAAEEALKEAKGETAEGKASATLQTPPEAGTEKLKEAADPKAMLLNTAEDNALLKTSPEKAVEKGQDALDFLKKLSEINKEEQAAKGGNELNLQGKDAPEEKILKGLPSPDGGPSAEKALLQETDPLKKETLNGFLNREELDSLEKQLKAVDRDGVLAKKGLHTGMKAEEFARTLTEALKELPELPDEPLKKLLSGKEYLKVLKEVTREQWSIRPEQFSEDTVKSLYENLDRQMKQTERMLKEMGLKDTPLEKSVSDLKGNLEFMNEINHAYTYLQVPIQFANQRANGDLYVYTNKKNLQDKDGELTAFLHFDMENLGSTDIAVKMKDRDVDTKFFLEDDASYELILSHAPELQRRLEHKGYSCKIEAVNEEKQVNFVDDFLKAEAPSGGLVHRYSFDMKA